MKRETRTSEERQIVLADMHGDGVHFDKRILGRTISKRGNASKKDAIEIN